MAWAEPAHKPDFSRDIAHMSDVSYHLQKQCQHPDLDHSVVAQSYTFGAPLGACSLTRVWSKEDTHTLTLQARCVCH